MGGAAKLLQKSIEDLGLLTDLTEMYHSQILYYSQYAYRNESKILLGTLRRSPKRWTFPAKLRTGPFRMGRRVGARDGRRDFRRAFVACTARFWAPPRKDGGHTACFVLPFSVQLFCNPRFRMNRKTISAERLSTSEMRCIQIYETQFVWV